MQVAYKPQWMQPKEISVLLVEDSQTDAMAITKAMLHGESLYDFRTNVENSLKGSLQYLEENPGTDVVLLDLNLPDAKSLCALNNIHARFPDMPVVILSGCSDMETVHHALHVGAQEFLLKGECSGAAIRQSLCQAIVRKQIECAYRRGDKL